VEYARWRGEYRKGAKTEVQTTHWKLTWRPARADRDTAFALAFPESLPALPPACEKNTKPSFSTKEAKKHKLRETQNGGTAAICEVTADRPQQHNNKSRRFFFGSYLSGGFLGIRAGAGVQNASPPLRHQYLIRGGHAHCEKRAALPLKIR